MGPRRVRDRGDDAPPLPSTMRRNDVADGQRPWEDRSTARRPKCERRGRCLQGQRRSQLDKREFEGAITRRTGEKGRRPRMDMMRSVVVGHGLASSISMRGMRHERS